MKLLVVSDIHGRYERLIDLMELHADADALVFLGDGVRDLYRAGANLYPFTIYAVKGNCDVSSVFVSDGSKDAPSELTFTLDGFRFYAIHGHTKAVKSSLTNAICAAVEKGADVLLYGHTHIPCEMYLPAQTPAKDGLLDKPLYVFNPGSLGESGDGKAHFGLIEIRNGSILFSHGTL